MKVARLLLAGIVVYGAGFGLFAATLPGPADATATDGIIVPTGAAGRIDRGLELLRGHAAQRMLVTGVAPGVTGATLARQYGVPAALFACCVDLGREAVDTHSNAGEAVGWIHRHHYQSVRLVTSNWHLWRARLELTHALGGGVAVIGDPVPGSPRTMVLFTEYNKLLVRFVALKLGIGE